MDGEEGVEMEVGCGNLGGVEGVGRGMEEWNLGESSGRVNGVEKWVRENRLQKVAERCG